MIFLYTCALVGKKMLKRETSSPVWSGNGYLILRFSALPKPFFCFQCLSMHVCVMCVFCMYVGECACGHPGVMRESSFIGLYLIYWGRLSQSSPELSNSLLSEPPAFASWDGRVSVTMCFTWVSEGLNSGPRAWVGALTAELWPHSSSPNF